MIDFQCIAGLVFEVQARLSLHTEPTIELISNEICVVKVFICCLQCLLHGGASIAQPGRAAAS
jgi:hypothetical protein